MDTKINILAITGIGIVVGMVGVLIWYTAYVKPEFETKDRRIASLAEDIEQIVAANSVTGSQPNDSELPIFTFEPAGSFSPEEKTEIERKLIEPYFAFHNEDELVAVTLNVRAANGSWSVFVTNVDGSYDSFTYGNPKSNSQQYWQPQCIDGCQFSNTFRAMYPQIAN